MSEITFDQIKDFQAQLAKQPAAGATARGPTSCKSRTH